MPPFSRPRRRLPIVVLGLVVAVGVNLSTALVATARPKPDAPAAALPFAAVPASSVPASAAPLTPWTSAWPMVDPMPVETEHASRDAVVVPAPELVAVARHTTRPAARPAARPASYSGRYHLWYPALGINSSWSWWGCGYGSGSTLQAGLFRWGCTGATNIYFLSHAWSTFHRIQLAYHSGAMKVGQYVWYANPTGNVSRWRVAWIREVSLSYWNDGYWAVAAASPSTPVMTFQTCDGSYSQYRIVVRLLPG